MRQHTIWLVSMASFFPLAISIARTQPLAPDATGDAAIRSPVTPSSSSRVARLAHDVVSTQERLLDHVQAFIQRTAAHTRMRLTSGRRPTTYRLRRRGQAPRKVEEMDTIWGVPKVAVVIIADVLAMAAFLSCIPFVMYLAKRRRPEMGSPDAAGAWCECLYPPEPPKGFGFPPPPPPPPPGYLNYPPPNYAGHYS